MLIKNNPYLDELMKKVHTSWEKCGSGKGDSLEVLTTIADLLQKGITEYVVVAGGEEDRETRCAAGHISDLETLILGQFLCMSFQGRTLATIVSDVKAVAARIWNILNVCHERRDLVDAERICDLTLSMAILGDVVAHGNPFLQQLHHMYKNWLIDVAAVLPQEVWQ